MTASKIKHWDDERNLGHSIIVTLAEGFAYRDNDIDDAALHVKGFPTALEAKRAVREANSCNCNRCATGA